MPETTPRQWREQGGDGVPEPRGGAALVDQGAAEPRVRAALADLAAARGSEHAALTALAGSRLLVPVVAVLTEAGGPAGGTREEKTTEMALPTLVGRDGRTAVVAFTCLDSLRRWRQDARPVPVPASRVWQAGLTEASAVVIDVAGPVPLTVAGARLAALAAGEPVPMPYEDPDVAAAVSAAIAGEPLIRAARLTPCGSGDGGPDLGVETELVSGCDPQHATAAIQRVARALAAATGSTLRRGIEVSATTADPQ
ncbi:MAG TPA: SseB family protein [Streptosporangiaceae bacterium]|nr:SseB family protein [Streptosporangiaceae bacterium]